MRPAPVAIAIVLAASLGACVRITEPSAELEARYYLAEDMNEYSAEMFTGFVSVWFTGPERVRTICPASIPVQGATVLPRGSPVKIAEILQVDAVDASYSDAKLQIADPSSGATHVVYVRWPESRALLTTEPPSVHEAATGR